MVVKEGDAGCLLEHETTLDYSFFGKGATVNSIIKINFIY